MIVYDLICSKEHRFETWFANSAAFDKQRKAKVVECPTCGDVNVRKAPMAPALARAGRAGDGEQEAAREAAKRAMETAAKLRHYVEENCDYVGDRFAEEARRIHYGESEARAIYGEATDQDAKAMDDEGIAYHRLPVPRKRDA